MKSLQKACLNGRIVFEVRWVVALCVLLTGVAVSPAAQTNRYVVKDNPLAAPPYDSLTNAAPDIQTAVDAAVAANGDMVLVAAGVYDTGGKEALPTYWGLTNRVVIDKTITVRSLDNDPATAIIEGAWDSATNGPAAIRGVFLASGATLAGFTVRNGATIGTPLRDGESNRNQRGGGVFCVGIGSVISNCVIANCASLNTGGGVSSGTLYDSLIVSNRCFAQGGGCYGSVLTRCAISHNVTPTSYGGGGYSVTATNCVLRYNQALGGGAVAEGTLINCLLYGNVAEASGGGGGVHGNVSLYNCTLVGNRVNGVSAGNGGGGILARVSRTVVAQNCIVYSNESVNGPNIYVAVGGTLYITNSCTLPDIPGWADGNITNDPRLVAWGSGFGTNHVAGDYRLRSGSPCIDAGTNGWWTLVGNDLDGGPRIRGGRVDIGCYESYFPAGTTFFIR